MPNPTPPNASQAIPALEIAHVLFMDVVAYSTLPMEQQTRILGQLQAIVRDTAEFKRAQKHRQLLRLPTGDGMALVFFGEPEAPVRCALEITRALRDHPDIKLRMGIHTGPVYRVEDINAARNVSGGGINMAQRVMDCGDAGHILASRSVADTLSQLESWCPTLHDLGEAEVKHGIRIHLYNLYAREIGNPQQPKKLREASVRARRKKGAIALAGMTVAAAVLVGSLVYSRRVHALTDRDTIVLADIVNKTGGPVFGDNPHQGRSRSLS